LYEPVANHTKNFFVAAEDDLKPLATPQEKMYKNETNCQLFPPKNHQSQLTMIINLQLLLLRRHFELCKNRQSYILPLKTRNCQLFPPKTHQSELTMIRNLQLLF
jgi:hypothetical protein